MPPERAREPTFGHLTPATLGLFVDLYEFTMAQGYVDAGHVPRATFDLFVRELPPDRGYLVAAGLEHVVAALESMTYDEAALDVLADAGFDEPFLDWLADFEFSGDVRAVPEGTVVFPDEPLVEVTAPLPEAQLLETLLINQVGYPTLVATKAARMRDVVRRHGDDQALVEFGSRRAHGTDAGVKLARAAYVGGFAGTSNVAAGALFDLPLYGTMAHSWVQSFATERAAFEAFVERYGEDAVLLVDTYDTLAGVDLAREVAADLGVAIEGVRLDSGDLVALSKGAAERLDEESIFVSSGMDEYRIAAFLEAGGVADGFGPGTALAACVDAPKLELVYKLVAVERDGDLEPTMKLSAGKETLPGAKSVRRRTGPDGFEGDVLDVPDGDAGGDDLLVDVLRDGERVYEPPPLDDLRDRALEQVASLPEPVRTLRDPATYPVETSDALQAVAAACRERLEAERGA